MCNQLPMTARVEPVDTLARTLWGEARGEGGSGMQAVANVILNRAGAPRWWGRDIVSVCRAPWQFSCWNVNDPNLPMMKRVTTADHWFRVALDIADRAVLGNLPDLTSRADHYYATWIPPPHWARGRLPVATHGRHLFFRLELR